MITYKLSETGGRGKHYGKLKGFHESYGHVNPTYLTFQGEFVTSHHHVCIFVYSM